MTAPTLYLWFPGTATAALNFYQSVFGGEVETFTFEQFGRTDGPPNAMAHGQLTGTVTLYATDAAPGEETPTMTGASLALLGTAEPKVLAQWFEKLSDQADVFDPLQERPWGATDGQLKDKYGVRWLIGWEH